LAARTDGNFLKEESTLENESKTTKPVLSRKEAAAYLGIHVNTLDKNDIPRIHIGRRTLFRQKTLEKILAGKEQSRRHE
jgi:hypothetical protein